MTAYTCPKHGTAFDDEGLPTNLGRTIGAYCGQCLEEQSAARCRVQDDFNQRFQRWHDWRRSGVPARGRNRTLANWRPQGRAQQAACRVVAGYTRAIVDQARAGAGLTLLGPPGVGKTHLCYAIVAAAFQAGILARYIVWADVLDRTKAAFATRDSADRGLLDELKRAPLLVLDEIGVRAGTDFDQALLFDLVDTRYRNELPTIVASNLTADMLDTIGERTADRLREANASVPIPGESQRSVAATDRLLLDAPPAIPEPELPSVPFPVCLNGAMVEKPLPIAKPELW